MYVELYSEFYVVMFGNILRSSGIKCAEIICSVLCKCGTIWIDLILDHTHIKTVGMYYVVCCSNDDDCLHFKGARDFWHTMYSTSKDKCKVYSYM